MGDVHLDPHAGKETLAAQARCEYVWGVRYVHAPVLRDADTDSDGDCLDEGGSERLYYAADANFSATALVGTDGAVVERYWYDPYGRVHILEPDWDETTWAASKRNELLFTGHRWDPETGLYHTLFRPYHPTLGRWAGRDPIGYAGCASLYGYASGEPVSHTDPLGLQAATASGWRQSQKDPNLYKAEADGASLEELAKHIGLRESSWQCIWPVDGPPKGWNCKPKEMYDSKKACACWWFDVSNLRARGGNDLSILFLHASQQSAAAWSGITTPGITEGRQLTETLAGASEMGGRPISNLTIVAHRGGTSGLHSSGSHLPRGEQYWDIASLQTYYRQQAAVAGGRFELAKRRRGPPLCWFAPGANVRLLGCLSTGHAAHRFAMLLRRPSGGGNNGAWGLAGLLEVGIPPGANQVLGWVQGLGRPLPFSDFMAPTYGDPGDPENRRQRNAMGWYFAPAVQ